MTALTILIIRHAEKPDTPADGPGLDEAGRPDAASLTLRGWQRAGAWAALLGTGIGGLLYPVPDAIYAAAPERAVSGKPSRRQVQTIRSLAARLGLAPLTHLAKGEELRLAGEILARTGVVLVCWEYALITEALLPALLGGTGQDGVPRVWDRARFDVLLHLTRDAPDAPWSFRQSFPCLLAGDTAIPLA